MEVHGGFDKMTDHQGYDLRDYPAGLDDVLNAFAPERRAALRAAVFEIHLQRKADAAWVDEQVRGMLELPAIIYKYIPFQHLDHGLPTVLRATQPSSLNDVMEGNISTGTEGKVADRDEWYGLILAKLRSIFGNDVLSDDEMNRRKNMYGDPRVSTIIRDYLSRHVGVVSFSADPLILTMWAHYSRNSGFVIGYNTARMRELGVDLRRVLYLELAPAYVPTRDNVVRMRFVDEARRQERIQAGQSGTGTPLLGKDVEFFELREDWRELAKVLFAKGDTWQDEKEIRLLVDLEATRPSGEMDENGYPVRVIDVPAEAVEEVYVGTNTPERAIKRIYEIVGVGEGQWRLIHTTAHAYRMQATATGINDRKPPTDAVPDGERGLDVASET